MNDIASKLKHLQKLVEKRAETTFKKLPQWRDEMRGSPNEIIRSSLFSGRRNGPRENYKDVILYVLGDSEITYSGEELRTFDEDVWLQTMHLARLQPLGECIQFTPYALIKNLRWTKPNQKTGKLNAPSKLHYKRLKESLTRMVNTSITVKSERIEKSLRGSVPNSEEMRLSTSLIRKFEWEGVDMWRVWVEPEMKALFGEVYYTRIEWLQRSQLSPTAKRIHGYYASHKNPYRIKIESLYKLCRLKSTLSGFRQKLSRYLDELKDIGFLDDHHYEGDLVVVFRKKRKGSTKKHYKGG